MTTFSAERSGQFTLGDRPVNRLGYGAMQLAGPHVMGPPADRAGAILTGQPSALASALTKISGEMGKIPAKDLRAAEAYNAFYFVPAFASKESLGRLLSSHPTLEQRLDQLARISADLSRP